MAVAGIAGAHCAVNGCESKKFAKGYCVKHYSRWRVHGDPLIVHPKAKAHREAQTKLRQERIASSAIRTQKTCFNCEEVFHRQSRGDRDAGKCCSRECGWEWQRAKRQVAKRATFTVYMRRRKCLVRRCVDCGCAIDEKGKHRCEPCRLKASELTRMRARAKQKQTGARAAQRKARKLRIRGVHVEAVNPFTVFGRDKWTCQLCGIKTPKKLRGSYDDRAPEVDHIVPIAEGGEHSYRNVQCACRRCNIMKSSRALGQLRLFG